MYSRQVHTKLFISSQLQSRHLLVFLSLQGDSAHSPQPCLPSKAAKIISSCKKKTSTIWKLKLPKSGKLHRCVSAPPKALLRNMKWTRLRKSFLISSLLTLRQRHHLCILWFTCKSAQIHKYVFVLRILHTFHMGSRRQSSCGQIKLVNPCLYSFSILICTPGIYPIKASYIDH